jgi:hypothetical protein
MARRKPTVTQSKGVTIVQTPAPSAPVTRRRRSGGAVTRKRKTHRRRSSSGGGSRGSFKNQLIGTAMGGFGFGWIMKNYSAQIPSLPLVGRSGTVAIASYFLAGKHPLVKDVGVAAAAIAGYSFGKTGTVEGYVDDD